jgi:hypothetical protein
MNVSRLLVVALVSAACAADAAAAQRSEDAAKPVARTTGTAAGHDTALIADFKARVDKYMEERKQAQKDTPPLKQTEDPAKISAAQEALAARIGTVRANAKHGDIFTPAIEAHLRRLLAPEMKGEDGRDAKAVMKEDAPTPGQISYKINAKYPEGTPLPSVAPTVLRSLPILPKGVEYRIVGKDLLLLDMDAQIVVDYMRNAIR